MSEPYEQNGQGSTALKEKPAAVEPRLDELPPFKVLLHNDEDNDMLYVVSTLVELAPVNRVKAMQIMLEAHTNGASLVVVTHKERAELYVEQFHSKGLFATLEADA